MSKTEETVSFSPREMEVLALAWQCFESEPKINIKKLADLTGYTEGSASVTIGKIKRKLKMAAAGTSEDTPRTTPKKPAGTKTPKSAGAKTPKSKGKRVASEAVSDTPSKKGRTAASEDEEFFKVKKEENVDGTAGDDGFGGFDGFGGYDTYQEPLDH